jgi:hypothetical protein
MLWFITASIIIVAAILASVLLFKRHKRVPAYMALMLAELLPVQVMRDLPFFLSSNFQTVLTFVCLLAWFLTIGLYFLRHPAIEQQENRNIDHD